MNKIYDTCGIRGLYRGFSVSVFGIFLYRSLYFGLYDSGKPFLDENPLYQTFLYKFLFAQLVSGVANIAMYPFDTIRRRMMMQGGRKDVLYRNTYDCYQKIKLNEGNRAFFKGNLSNLMRSTGGALVLVFYDQIKEMLF